MLHSTMVECTTQLADSAVQQGRIAALLPNLSPADQYIRKGSLSRHVAPTTQPAESVCAQGSHRPEEYQPVAPSISASNEKAFKINPNLSNSFIEIEPFRRQSAGCSASSGIVPAFFCVRYPEKTQTTTLTPAVTMLPLPPQYNI